MMISDYSNLKFYRSLRISVKPEDGVVFFLEYENTGDSISDAQLINISTTGLGFISNEKIDVGTELIITLKLKRKYTHISGKISRSVANDLKKEGNTFYGISLQDEEVAAVFLQNYMLGLSIDRIRNLLLHNPAGKDTPPFGYGNDKLSSLFALFNDTNKFATKKDYLERVLGESARILQAKEGILFLRSNQSKELTPIIQIGKTGIISTNDYRQKLAALTLGSKESLNVNRENLPYSLNSEDTEEKSVLSHPIYNFENEIIGVVQFCDKREGDNFELQDEQIIKVISLLFSNSFTNCSDEKQAA